MYCAFYRERLPGKFFELNIYDGLFLGGIGDSIELFLGHVDWLRGCLSAVFYNGVDVLKRARYRTLQSDAHGVTWSCASEFDAVYSSEISFMEDGAFLSLPNPISRTGVRYSIVQSVCFLETLEWFRTLLLAIFEPFVRLKPISFMQISPKRFGIVSD